MTTAATISAKLILDSKSYDDGLSSAGKKATDFQSKMRGVGSAMLGVGTKMTAGLTLPIAAAGAGMIKAASDLEESLNAVNVVFGESDKIIKDYGETVATTAGLSQAEFSQMSAVTGAFLKNVGFDAEEAANKTITLTERASDMASIFNTDVSQALEAIQSGLKGEFNPLEQFGVKLNAAAISARALEMGLADTKAELTDSHKATAALALVMEQTEQFAGDFANTSDGLANSTKILKAQFTDQAAALGTQLLPVALKVLNFFSNLLTKFTELSPSAKTTILVILGIVAAIGPLVTIVGGLISAFSAIIPIVTAIAGVLTFPLIAIIAAVIAVIALLATAWKKDWGGIQKTVKKVVAIIKKIVAAFTAAFAGDWTEFGALLREAWDMLWSMIGQSMSAAFSWMQSAISNFIISIFNFFRGINWGEMGANIVKGIVGGIASLGSWAIDQMRSFASNMAEAFTGFFGIDSKSKLMFEYGGNLAGGLIAGAEPIKDIQMGSDEMLGGSFEGSSNKSTVVNLTLPGGVITKTMMGDILANNDESFSDKLAEAIEL